MDSSVFEFVLPYLSRRDVFVMRRVAKWCTYPNYNYLRLITLNNFNITKSEVILALLNKWLDLHPRSLIVRGDKWLDHDFVIRNVKKLTSDNGTIPSGIFWENLTRLELDLKDDVTLPSLPNLKHLSIRGRRWETIVVNVEEMPNLEKLNISGIVLNVVNLSIFPKLIGIIYDEERYILPTTLKKLMCMSKRMKIRSISHLTNLEYLQIEGEGKSAHDLTYMSKLTKLKCIDCANLGIKNVSFLSKCTQLEKAILPFCDIKDISALPESIKKLNVHFNNVRNIKCLPRFKNLAVLDISENYISDLLPLTKCLSLVKLSITFEEKHIKLLSPLTNLTKLELNIYAEENTTEDFDIQYLYSFPKLKTLMVYILNSVKRRVNKDVYDMAGDRDVELNGFDIY